MRYDIRFRSCIGVQLININKMLNLSSDHYAICTDIIQTIRTSRYQLNLKFLATTGFRHKSGVNHGSLFPLCKCVKVLLADVACTALMVGCHKEIT
ncbi:hypothetical protein PsAD2_03545 [Pseudovibrio axinellae]|uniref:Uncharacterized protein n=1 Tax=Pseudovibrio axinellae TaxID=989403 RepID=A0A165VZR4_9HYPH|nr:hypothetical protein PsAD2_03545 [Pseudovibrio axinellae]SER80788.1 hypothetical protein SAMN05421798_1264 [Pseudovibrio axinellae]